MPSNSDVNVIILDYLLRKNKGELRRSNKVSLIKLINSQIIHKGIESGDNFTIFFYGFIT